MLAGWAQGHLRPLKPRSRARLPQGREREATFPEEEPTCVHAGNIAQWGGRGSGHAATRPATRADSAGSSQQHRGISPNRVSGRHIPVAPRLPHGPWQPTDAAERGCLPRARRRGPTGGTRGSRSASVADGPSGPQDEPSVRGNGGNPGSACWNCEWTHTEPSSPPWPAQGPPRDQPRLTQLRPQPPALHPGTQACHAPRPVPDHPRAAPGSPPDTGTHRVGESREEEGLPPRCGGLLRSSAVLSRGKEHPHHRIKASYEAGLDDCHYPPPASSAPPFP